LIKEEANNFKRENRKQNADQRTSA
jgi:hypothetical protein